MLLGLRDVGAQLVGRQRVGQPLRPRRPPVPVHRQHMRRQLPVLRAAPTRSFWIGRRLLGCQGGAASGCCQALLLALAAGRLLKQVRGRPCSMPSLQIPRS